MKINLTKTPQIVFFIFVLPLLSVVLVLILNYFLQPLNNLWFYPLIDTVGTIGAYVFLYSQFNSYAWEWSIFSVLGIVDFPVIGGRWKGNFTSSFNRKKTQAILEVKQTFSKIDICLYCKESNSTSLIADFIKLDNDQMELHYEYHNEPYVNTKKTMHGHEGVVKLTYLKNDNILRGSYYNSSQHKRGNVGNLSFKFQSNELQEKF